MQVAVHEVHIVRPATRAEVDDRVEELIVDLVASRDRDAAVEREFDCDISPVARLSPIADSPVGTHQGHRASGNGPNSYLDRTDSSIKELLDPFVVRSRVRDDRQLPRRCVAPLAEDDLTRGAPVDELAILLVILGISQAERVTPVPPWSHEPSGLPDPVIPGIRRRLFGCQLRHRLLIGMRGKRERPPGRAGLRLGVRRSGIPRTVAGVNTAEHLSENVPAKLAELHTIGVPLQASALEVHDRVGLPIFELLLTLRRDGPTEDCQATPGLPEGLEVTRHPLQGSADPPLQIGRAGRRVHRVRD